MHWISQYAGISMNQSDRLNGLRKPQNGSSVFAAQPSFLLVILLLASGCVYNPSAAYNPSAVYMNPDFSCPSSKIVEPDTGYPFPIQQYPFVPNDSQKSVTELKDFCARMKLLFEESNLTVREAGQFYALLEGSNGKVLPGGPQLFLHNDCYGMPLCDVEPFVMNKQVMLKKVTNDEYEIFLYDIYCGINYTHWAIHLELGVITGITLVDRWSESFPC